MNGEPNDFAATAAHVSDEKAQAYIEQRLKPQLAYYEQESARCKKGHRLVSYVQLAATVTIPVVNVFIHSVYASSILAGVAALATGLAQIERYHERWLSYRQTAGALDTLSVRYRIASPPYDGPDRNDRLIHEAETLLGQESSTWVQTTRQMTAPASGPTILYGG